MTLLDYLWSKAPAGQVFHRQGDGVRVDLKELFDRRDTLNPNLIAEVLGEVLPDLFPMYYGSGLDGINGFRCSSSATRTRAARKRSATG